MKTRKSVQIVENAQLKENLPEFNQGDTVLVQVIVKEGSRERTQPFERTFQLHSPLIKSVELKRKGKVRQSKLYYLRERSGRSARIQEKI